MPRSTTHLAQPRRAPAAAARDGRAVPTYVSGRRPWVRDCGRVVQESVGVDAQGAVAGIVAYGGYQVLNGETTVGRFMAFFAAIVALDIWVRAFARFACLAFARIARFAPGSFSKGIDIGRITPIIILFLMIFFIVFFFLLLDIAGVHIIGITLVQVRF